MFVERAFSFPEAKASQPGRLTGCPLMQLVVADSTPTFAVREFSQKI